MTRHTKRCWRRTAAWTGAALLLSTDAVAVGVRFSQDHNTAVLITAVGLGYGAFLAGCFAIAWCWYTGQAVVHDRGRRPASTGRPAWTAQQLVEHRARAQAEEDMHAVAMAAVAEDVPLPERTPCDGDTVVMSPVGAVLSWDSGTHGRHVAAAQPWPWSPMAEARHVAAYATGETGATGRHAGRWAA